MYEMMPPESIQMAKWESRLHGPKPKPCNLYFPQAWESLRWMPNKYFRIVKTTIVPFAFGLITPGVDWVDVALNNNNATQIPSLNLYPVADGIIYEMLVGMGEGNYQIAPYIPASDRYLLRLGYDTMYPDLTSAINVYLGEFEPEDSPADDPMIKLWAVNQMQPWILKVYVRPGCDFEKPILVFKIAKHNLVEINKPDVFDTIEYYSEIKEVG